MRHDPDDRRVHGVLPRFPLAWLPGYSGSVAYPGSPDFNQGFPGDFSLLMLVFSQFPRGVRQVLAVLVKFPIYGAVTDLEVSRVIDLE